MNEQAANRAHDVVAHLQAAALEMIAAARAFLDVAEDLVKEPGEATAMAATLANLAGRIVPLPGWRRQARWRIVSGLSGRNRAWTQRSTIRTANG